jgi:hypothetical protein
MILMGANPFRGPLKGVDPEKIFFETFLGPEMATSEASAIWVEKVPLPMAWVMDLSPHQNQYAQAPFKKQVHW